MPDGAGPGRRGPQGAGARRSTCSRRSSRPAKRWRRRIAAADDTSTPPSNWKRWPPSIAADRPAWWRSVLNMQTRAARIWPWPRWAAPPSASPTASTSTRRWARCGCGPRSTPAIAWRWARRSRRCGPRWSGAGRVVSWRCTAAPCSKRATRLRPCGRCARPRRNCPWPRPRCSTWPRRPSGWAIGARRATHSRRHVTLLAGSTPPVAVVRRLGDLSMALGDARAAVRWWRRAATDTADVALLVRLAQAETRVGDFDAARQTVARALALAPADAGARRLQTLLGAKG